MKPKHFRSSGNPLFPGKGVCDPHVRVFNDRFYLYATHDASPENPQFVMRDWWIWSSEDLVDWKHECTLNPQEIGLEEGFTGCWATDAIERDGSYYWYLSAGMDATWVLKGESPVGPWTNVRKEPLVQRADLGGAAAHDPSVLIDHDGRAYMLVGFEQYYLLELNDDMVSFTGSPFPIEVIHPSSPLGPGTLDDKPTLHKRDGIYYLSWGCFYAMSEHIRGPYEYKGTFLKEENISPAFRYHPERIRCSAFMRSILKSCEQMGMPSTFDRHGSFFEYQDQWYFICNDHSQTESCYYRDCVIATVAYRDNGEIAPIQICQDGVPAAGADTASRH